MRFIAAALLALSTSFASRSSAADSAAFKFMNLTSYTDDKCSTSESLLAVVATTLRSHLCSISFISLPLQSILPRRCASTRSTSARR